MAGRPTVLLCFSGLRLLGAASWGQVFGVLSLGLSPLTEEHTSCTYEGEDLEFTMMPLSRGPYYKHPTHFRVSSPFTGSCRL